MKKTILALIILSYPFSLYSGEKEQKGRHSLSFAVTEMKSLNIQARSAAEISSRIASLLKNEAGFQVNGSNLPVVTGKIIESCAKDECSGELKALYREKIILLGEAGVDRYKRGEKKISRYATEELFAEKYSFTLYVYDSASGKRDLVFTKESGTLEGLYAEAEKTAVEIRDYYKKREESKKEIDKMPAAIEKNNGIYSFHAFSAAPSILFPLGRYSKMTDLAAGIDLSLSGYFSFSSAIFLNPGLSLYSFNPARENIKSIWALFPHISAGYCFGLSGNFSLSPYIMAGYMLQYVYGDKNGAPGSSSYSFRNEFYYNPSLGAGIEAAYSISARYRIYINTLYFFFADSGSLSHVAGVNSGIRMKF